VTERDARPGRWRHAAEPRPVRRVRLSIARHPRDLLRLLIAAAVVEACWSLTVFAPASPVEMGVYTQLRTLPPVLAPVWAVVNWFGTWVAVVGVAAVALYFKRIRIGLECVVAAAATWALTWTLNIVHGGRAIPAAWAGLLGGPPADLHAEFAARHVAVAAVLVTVLGPAMARFARGLLWAVPALVAVSDIVLAAQLPLDVVAGGFAGWGVGTLFQLILGRPGRKTSEDVVRRELELAGVAPVALTLVTRRFLVPKVYRVHTATGETLRAEVVHRLHRRAGVGYKLRRMLVSLEVEDEPEVSTADHEVEHEALATMLAERAGVRTPSIVLACKSRHGSPLLVRREIDGRPLSHLAAGEIDSRLLTAIWTQIATLGEARIAHHDLRAKNILIDTDGRPWLLGFTFSRAGASPTRCAQDLAEGLVSVGAIVGVQRAVDSICEVVAADRLHTALQYLQILALPRRITTQPADPRYLITELRETLADRLGCPVPVFRSPVRPGNVAGLLFVGAAVYLLLPQLSSMTLVIGSLERASWWWLLVAVLTGLVAIVLSAVSILGSSPIRLPVWRTIAVQMGAAFTGRTTPGGAGFFGINIAYLERLGLRRSRAIGVTLLNMAGTGLVGFLTGVAGVFALGVSGTFGTVTIPTGWPLLVVVAAVLILAGVLLGTRLGRRRILQPALDTARELLSTVHHPVRALQLFGGALGYLVVSGLGLAASLTAFGAHAPLLAVVSVFIVAQTLGHLSPVPGGLGAVEAVMVAGLGTVGIPPTAAVVGVLTSRLLTYWFPALPGMLVFRLLQHHNVV
jgi:glycosyltransferase 2 family protein